jgi:hypothetical protein
MTTTYPGQARLEHLKEAARDARSAALLAWGTALLARLRARLGTALVIRHVRRA